ncbi:hypothetical protein [Thermoflavimicrobium daqui]|nr:hypothetical protein [Thermoflavimicrobium daqui]
MKAKIPFKNPELKVVGEIKKVVGAGGHNNDDGNGNIYSKLANNGRLN